MKDPTKPLIVILAAVAIILTFAFFLTGKTKKANETPNPEPLSSVSKDAIESQSRTQKSEPGENLAPSDSKPKKPTQDVDEDDIAIPVEGNPLVVTLLLYDHLGQISIENYNKVGEKWGPSGEPLKSGTKVQIPNPDRPGEKIHFVVP